MDSCWYCYILTLPTHLCALTDIEIVYWDVVYWDVFAVFSCPGLVSSLNLVLYSWLPEVKANLFFYYPSLSVFNMLFILRCFFSPQLYRVRLSVWVTVAFPSDWISLTFLCWWFIKKAFLSKVLLPTKWCHSQSHWDYTPPILLVDVNVT